MILTTYHLERLDQIGTIRLSVYIIITLVILTGLVLLIMIDSNEK